MSAKAKKFGDLTAPLYADPRRRARIETEKRAILAGMRLTELRAEHRLTAGPARAAPRYDPGERLSNRARRGHATVNHQALDRSSRRQPRAARRVRDRDVSDRDCITRESQPRDAPARQLRLSWLTGTSRRLQAC
jgi:hypothetical protein